MFPACLSLLEVTLASSRELALNYLSALLNYWPQAERASLGKAAFSSFLLSDEPLLAKVSLSCWTFSYRSPKVLAHL